MKEHAFQTDLGDLIFEPVDYVDLCKRLPFGSRNVHSKTQCFFAGQIV
jgi:hypothetical protein